MAIEYTGSLQGKVRAHTPETLAATWAECLCRFAECRAVLRKSEP